MNNLPGSETVFNVFESHYDDNNEKVILGLAGQPQVNTVVYTSRSWQREVKTLLSALEAASNQNSILIWVAPFHAQIYDNIYRHFTLDKNRDIKKMIWLSPAHGHLNSLSAAQVVFDGPGLQALINEIDASQKFMVKIHAAISRLDSEQDDIFHKMIHQIFTQAASRLKTVQHFEKKWQYNFKRNHELFLQSKDVSKIDIKPPEYILLAGPSADDFLAETTPLSQNTGVWCADTSLYSCLCAEIKPDLVFSIDAGHGSAEHFFQNIPSSDLRDLNIVLDPLSFHALYRMPFRQIYSYASSHPLVQQLLQTQSKTEFTPVENKTGDVFGAIDAVLKLLHPQAQPTIIGHDGRASKYSTHLRGSAYHYRKYFILNRLQSAETLFFEAAQKYH